MRAVLTGLLGEVAPGEFARQYRRKLESGIKFTADD